VRRIEEAFWLVVKEEVQNGIRIYYLKENRVCSCGEPAIHFHEGHWPCCGKQGCCPEIVEPVDPELELLVSVHYLLNCSSGKAKTQNVVAIADFEKSVDLEKICGKTKAIYEPEQFPGAILRLKEPYNTTILIFASGKVVIAGLKSSDQLTPTINRIEEIIAANQ
jgi:TATA-box binding protein (TBP) (component of TFIID and TFIIIB)